MPDRRVATVDLRPDEPAVILTSDVDGRSEVWLINTNAPVDLIVAECNAAFADMEAQRAALEAERADERATCRELRATGRRRALWLLLAVLAGVLLPSPLRGFYAAHSWLPALQAVTCLVVGALLALAAREHLVMRRLTR